MRELAGAEGSYEQRCDALLEYGIALWDVLAQSVRPGSMDADIALHTAEVNDFKEFFSKHSGISLVCFNGQKAAQLYRRFVAVEDALGPGQLETLPSTSPAYASMTYADKLLKWSNAIA